MAHILPHPWLAGDMCGRYVAARGPEDLAAAFEAEDVTGAALRPDWNVAPTDAVPVVVTRHRSGEPDGPVRRQVRAARWGLVPSWAADTKRAAKLINARAETVTQLPAFRSAVRRRRCLVPADGWYEWAPREDGPGRQPTYLTPLDGSVLAFAGLYELWGPDRLLTSTIVTTAALGPLTAVHSRMPLVLPRSRWADWLDPAREDVTDLLVPAPGLVEEIELRPVGPAVGAVANDGPGLVERAPVEATLF
jgi:putative SOS response-associated peptidase YedK